MNTQELMQAAKAAAPVLATLDGAARSAALLAMAEALEEQEGEILAANQLDLAAAHGRISPVMLDRLSLNSERIAAMADGIRAVATLPDPLGKTLASYRSEDGLLIERVSVPMGVIAIIYESRPNVTSDAAALALKAGSACLLRGGRDAYRSSFAIVSALQAGLMRVGLPRELLLMVEDTSHESALLLMKGKGYIDLLTPRGSARLIRTCVENALVPIIETGTGICHIYVDGAADTEMALSIVENAKTSRPSVCNAAEVCLVDKKIAKSFLPLLRKRLQSDREAAGKPPVELRLDGVALSLIDGIPAAEGDFDTEFLDYTLAVGVVDGVEEAIAHITAHSTKHSEAIVTEDAAAAARFTAAVDSAAVYVNASTRFTDGGKFGLGCEMGISTQKLHARGPMGLSELTTYKYIIRGAGQIR